MAHHKFLRIRAPKPFRLDRAPVELNPLYRDDADYSKKLDRGHKALEELQERLFAEREKAVLILFQGMDTSGKDGAIKHVMSGVNPQGCRVASFKAPNPTELAHDFLWREILAAPERGQIGIFNRSYYEEVLVTRVHRKILKAERLPDSPALGKKKFWRARFQDIVHHEKYLHRQGYEIIKIFIHISKAEQKKRLLERFEKPQKNWKISLSDIHERRFWKDYQQAYEDCIRHTSSKSCPWYIVPGNDKRNARLLISEIILQRMKAMKLAYPTLSPADKRKLGKLREELG